VEVIKETYATTSNEEILDGSRFESEADLAFFIDTLLQRENTLK
jgi:hypothetical protein